MPHAAPPPGAERLLRWIMGGIVLWGAFHALGAWTLNHDARRPLVVLACVAAFLGFWLAMLASRNRRCMKERGQTNVFETASSSHRSIPKE
ncbi:MAG: hypothetical protein WCQ91_05355 [Planctomycetota bacterium]